VVIEDSIVGLNAARGAGMICIITPTASTANGDFVSRGATAVLDTLQEGGRQVRVALFKI
jgi:beta-phosphoglucomutase-like phosphatase (HAD superfamily)